MAEGVLYEILPGAQMAPAHKFIDSHPDVFWEDEAAVAFIALQKRNQRAMIQRRSPHFRRSFRTPDDQAFAALGADAVGRMILAVDAAALPIPIATGKTEKEVVRKCLDQGWRALAFSDRTAMLAWLFADVS